MNGLVPLPFASHRPAPAQTAQTAHPASEALFALDVRDGAGAALLGEVEPQARGLTVAEHAQRVVDALTRGLD